MKELKGIIFFTILMTLMSCSSNKDKNNNLLIIDITKQYPKIIFNLSDLADIKYVKLKESPDYVVATNVLKFSDTYIIVQGAEDEILIFDHEGNLTNKFNCVGPGPHEYQYASNLYLDEEYEELVVHDSFLQKYLVYSLDGQFIRAGKAGVENYIFSFTKDEFICYNKITNKPQSDLIPYFSIISKKDWEVKKEIPLPIDEIREIEIKKYIQDDYAFNYSPMHRPLIRCSDGFVLNDPASDTIYKYSYDGKLSPFIVRTPPVKSMRSPVYLRFGVETEQYIFLTVTSIDEYNSEDMFPSIQLVYDKENKSIHEYQLIFEDWPEYPMIFDAEKIVHSNTNVTGTIALRAHHLVPWYNAGYLDGELREIVATMDEEDNPVITLINFK